MNITGGAGRHIAAVDRFVDGTGAADAHPLKTDCPVAGEGISIGCVVVRPKEQAVRIVAFAEGEVCINFGVKIGYQRFVSQAENIDIRFFCSNGDAIAADADIPLIGG